MKLILIRDNRGRLANQLWNFASIYAFALEKKIECENYCFFRYQKYFNFTIENRIIHIFSNQKKVGKIAYIVHEGFARIFEKIAYRRVVLNKEVEFFLPPSVVVNKRQLIELEKIETNTKKNIFFSGWIFRNPIGLEKYHEQIKKIFRPKEQYCEEAEKNIALLRKKYKKVVGVHIRQGDYKTWEGGKFFFTQKEVRSILEEYIQSQKNITVDETVFMVCSDGFIDEGEFLGLNLVKGPGGEATDLYALSLTDLIIGSNSTYGRWAAYYGQIPFFQFMHDGVDWNKDKGLDYWEMR